VTVKYFVFWDDTQCGSLGTDVSEVIIASIIRVERISGLRTLTITSN
jgi:hypothetical protein